MGFNKKYITQEVNELKKEYRKIGHSKFRRMYIKYDVTFYSNNESMVFIQYVVFNNKNVLVLSMSAFTWLLLKPREWQRDLAP